MAEKEKIKKTPERIKTKIPEKKAREVKKLAEDMKKSKTILIISIKGVPSQQLQKIKKDLRGKALVKVIKKNILHRAIDETKIAEMNPLKECVQADCAIGLSEEEAFEIAAWLTENRSPISAREGQTAEGDIKIEAGPTDLMPGPAISELGSVGLKVSVEEGKIAIRESKIIVKKGDKISPGVAAVLQKLNIKPFMIGLNPTVIYDSKEKKIYVGVKVDKKETVNNLLINYSKALSFAQRIRYYCKETIGYLIAKANNEMKSLEKLALKTEEKKEKDKEEATEEEKIKEKPENAENKSEEEAK